MRSAQVSSWTALIVGDGCVLVLFTLVGFSTHGELASAGGRMFTTLIPLFIGWGLAAPWLGLYAPNKIFDPRQLWRPLLAAFLAAPLAAWLRGAWLNAPILPLFVLVMAATVGFMSLVWRGFWIVLNLKRKGYG